MRKLLLVLLLMSMPAAAWGQRSDSARSARDADERVVVRTPAPGALDVYRDDPAFQYDRARTGTSWWDRVKRWLWETFFAPVIDPAGTWQRPLLYVLFGAALLFAFVQFARMRGGGGWKAPARSTSLRFRDIEENLDAADFDALVAEAADAGDYRRAVRLLYLYVLRTLADTGRIAWDPAKTNRAYVRELAGQSGRLAKQAGELRALTRLFERVWYGHAEVEAQTFDRLRTRFGRFRQQAKQGDEAPAGSAAAS